MAAFSIGQTIGGRYRLEAVLARGGMGAVYRAIDERIGRPVAVKVLLAELAAEATEVARFEREAKTVASLHHPGIVQVLDVGREGTDAYIVMEHVSGRTIADLLTKEGKVEPARAADVIEQALFAISVAHAAGIVHRDLKPGNLMLVPTGGREMVKVLDFGIAQLKTGAAYTRLTQTGVLLGTPAYMAPEQARGEPCDGRTDVYAMGVLLWCMLTGKKPFAGNDMASVLVKVIGEVPTRADLVEPTVPPQLAVICEVALQKRPADRFASAAAFAAALVDLRSRGPALVGPTPTPRSFGAQSSAPGRALDPRHVATLLTPTGASMPPAVASPSYQRVSSPGPAPVVPTPPMLSAQTPWPPSGVAAPPASSSPLSALSTRTLAIAAAVLVLLTGTLTCLASAYVFQARSSPPSAPPPSLSVPSAPRGGNDGSVCERTVRCCRTMGGGDNCDGFRAYPTWPAGEAQCQQMLTSYEQQAAVSGLHCD